MSEKRIRIVVIGGSVRPANFTNRALKIVVKELEGQSDVQVDRSSESSLSVLGMQLMGAHAERQCFLRALNSQMPKAHRVVDDALARKLLRWRWRFLLALLRFGSLEQYMALQLDRRWPGGLIYGALRSRMIDEMLDARLRRRYPQVVILGAGLQTRAFRPDMFPAGTTVFEVDGPEAQEEKQLRVERALGTLPEYVRFAACDITPTYWGARNLDPADLEGEPLDNEIKAAIMTDVRVRRQLRMYLNQGVPNCRALAYSESGTAMCKKDDIPFTIFAFPQPTPDLPGRIQESVYFCREEGIYYYRNVGGATRRDLWMGPFRIEKKAWSLDDVETP